MLNFFTDRAEQIASLPLSTNDENANNESQFVQQINQNQVALQTDDTTDVGLSCASDETVDISITSESRVYVKSDKNNEDSNAHKTIGRSDSRESGNNYYSRESLSDNKIQHKQLVENYDSESSSLTIHNDIARKPLQKKQNDNVSIKQKNSYDKKLNQPNAKPSISNVFSSLNEYINAPSAKLENLDDSNIIRKNSGDLEGISKINDAANVIGNVSSNVGSDIKAESKVDDALDTGINIKKISSTVPPEYQNILLPLKLETALPDSKESAEVELEENISLLENLREIDKEPLYTNTTLPAVVDRPKESKSIIDRPEHVYENVYIGTDIPKSQELYATVNKAKQKSTESKNQEDTKHTYENVDFDEPKKIGNNDGKESVYECIYIGGRENFPETTTELEIAAKKITDQLHVNEKNSDVEGKGINLAKLVFQTVQLGTPEMENKPVGFSHIDDLSEEELNKYLADLEAEERAQEATTSYENSLPASSYRDSESLVKNKFQSLRDDEDANEAPIFESVTIGELPEVSRIDLLEKAKKFPVIDYSKSGPSGETTGDFLARKGSGKFTELTKVISEARAEKGKGRRSKKTNEKMRKTSDNSEPSIENLKVQDDDSKPVESDDSHSPALEAPSSSSEGYESASAVEIDERVEPGGVEEDKIAEESEEELPVSNSNSKNVFDSVKSNETNDDVESSEVSPVVDGNNIADDSSLSTTNVAQSESKCLGDTDVSVSTYLEQSSNDEIQSQSEEASNIVKRDVVPVENNVEHLENDFEGTERPTRPLTLDIVSTVNMDEEPVAGRIFLLELKYSSQSKTKGER